MDIAVSSGWTENYWAGWPWSKMYGGSENMLIEVACELAKSHRVTVRLPYERDETVFRGVRWVGLSHPALRADVLFCFDDFERRDSGARTLLVATRSDPPRHTDFDDLIFYSRTHARLMGHASRPAVGGGVDLAAYAGAAPRLPRRVICTSSPDRCPAAAIIGREFDFVHTYRSVPGLPATVELTRAELVELQRTASVQIHPYDAPRETEFFGMSILEALAAGTPCVLSDGPALVELWGEAATILPRPIDYSAWSEEIGFLLEDQQEWQRMSDAGRALAARYSWPRQAAKFMEVAWPHP